MNTSTQRKVFELEIKELLNDITEIDEELEASNDFGEADDLHETRFKLYDLLKAKRTQLTKFNELSENLANLENDLRHETNFDIKTTTRHAITATNESLIAIVRGA